MDELTKICLIVFGSVTPFGLLTIYIFLNPEKIETWSSIIYKALSSCGNLFKFAHKKYVVHDLQGRVNSFIKEIKKQTTSFGDEKLKIEFIGESINRSSFIDDNKVVLRLRRNDPDDHNFVHGTYLFVSKSLLSKCKRYLSQTQKEAIDLFTCSKLIMNQKPSVTGFFIDEYLHPKTEMAKSKIALYLDDFKQIDDGNMYFPILLQELKYLGEKVFGRRRESLIIAEVKAMTETLKKVVNRDAGDEETDMAYYGNYCKFAIMIAGKIQNIREGTELYERYIRRHLLPKDVETIYLLTRFENKEKLIKLCEKFSDKFFIDDQRQLTQTIRKNGDKYEIDSYLVVLRKIGIDLIQSST